MFIFLFAWFSLISHSVLFQGKLDKLFWQMFAFQRANSRVLVPYDAVQTDGVHPSSFPAGELICGRENELFFALVLSVPLREALVCIIRGLEEVADECHTDASTHALTYKDHVSRSCDNEILRGANSRNGFSLIPRAPIRSFSRCACALSYSLLKSRFKPHLRNTLAEGFNKRRYEREMMWFCTLSG